MIGLGCDVDAGFERRNGAISSNCGNSGCGYVLRGALDLGLGCEEQMVKSTWMRQGDEEGMTVGLSRQDAVC